MHKLTFTCRIPMGVNQVPRFPTLSKRARLAALARIKNEYQNSVRWSIKLSLSERYGPRKCPRWEKAEIGLKIYFETNRERDQDNYSGGGGVKWLIDAVRKEGVICSDTAEKLLVHRPEFAVDRANPRCEVTVTRRDG